MNPFTIQNHLGAPTFFKNDKLVFPLLFWQSEILERDAHSLMVRYWKRSVRKHN